MLEAHRIATWVLRCEEGLMLANLVEDVEGNAALENSIHNSVLAAPYLKYCEIY